MKRLRIPLASFAIAFLLAVPSAKAFTIDPLQHGTGNAAQFDDPDEQYKRLADPNSSGTSNSGQADRGISFGATRPNNFGGQYLDPAKIGGPDNQHLYWNNSTRYR
ncbi:MAG: hypothetical protein IPK66_01495 [Rhodospirillales bacterium]|nr:hypothetical protein [Rhodospirillales bacterium]